MAKKTTKKTTALAKTAPRSKPKTEKAAPLVVAEPPKDAPTRPDLTIAGDAIMLGALGTVELTLTPEEEAILAEPVPEAEVRVKPNGAVYLPHYVYTRWLNRAFGRLKWAMTPVSAPKEVVSGKKRQVVQYYVLHIHGKPVAVAAGEQDYWEGNADQSYGDAAEGAVASALRRCMKRIGVGMELWDRQWGHRFLEANAVAVKVEKRNVQGGATGVKTQWRMKADPPLPGELKAGQRVPAQREPSAGTHRDDNAPITQDQQKRLFTILSHSGRSQEWLKAYLKRTIKSESTKDITRKDYDTVVRAIEHPDVEERPAVVDEDTIDWGGYRHVEDREPGEDG